MTAEEKLIIEQLLTDCSPTVQNIINANKMFTIPPPPCEEEESDDDDDNREEESDELMATTQFDTFMEDDSGEMYQWMISPTQNDTASVSIYH